MEVHAKESSGDGGVGAEALFHHILHDGLGLRARGVVEPNSEIMSRDQSDGEEEEEERIHFHK